MRQLVSSIRALLFATVITPLLIVPFAPYPFVFGKMIFLRSIAALVGALAVIYGVRVIRQQEWKASLGWLRNPVVLAVAAFILSAAASTIFALDRYRAFFGEIERAEGLYGLLAYLVLFLAMLFFFNREHWKWYFRLGLVVGAAVITHVFLRYFEVRFLVLGDTRQPGSFLGNPAFVASFLVLLFAYAAFVYRDAKGFWRYFAAAVGLAGLAVIGVLAVRGALVGAAAGVLVFALGAAMSGGGRVKSALKTAFLLVFVLGVFLWFTRGSDFWGGVPVVSRVANFSFESASVQSRLLSLGVSWEAFKERPIFGWGLENYGIAYNKYYNPAYAVYADDWFDRAHNKVLDVLVMQGAVGVISYAGIFCAFFYVLWKAKTPRSIRLPLGAVIVAYFVQNLFVFDQINSYVPFFVILAFCASLYEWQKESTGEVRQIPKSNRFLLGGAAAAFIAAAAYALVVWNLIPFSQAWGYMAIVGRERPAEEIATEAERFLRPYNFSQKDIRARFLQAVPVKIGAEANGPHPLISKAIGALEEVARREPYDLRLKVRLAEAYHQLGDSNPELYERGMELIEEARGLSPKRQNIRGLQIFLLSGRGKYEEAIQLARETIALESRAAKPHYWLGMTLALSGSASVKEETVKELGIALDGARALAAEGSYVLFSESDFENIMIAYQSLGADDGFLESYRVAKEFFPLNLNFHRTGLVAARAQRDAEEMIRIAERIQKLEPGSRDEMEVIIDLARKRKWQILDSL